MTYTDPHDNCLHIGDIYFLDYYSSIEEPINELKRIKASYEQSEEQNSLMTSIDVRVCIGRIGFFVLNNGIVEYKKWKSEIHNILFDIYPQSSYEQRDLAIEKAYIQPFLKNKNSKKITSLLDVRFKISHKYTYWLANEKFLNVLIMPICFLPSLISLWMDMFIGAGMISIFLIANIMHGKKLKNWANSILAYTPSLFLIDFAFEIESKNYTKDQLKEFSILLCVYLFIVLFVLKPICILTEEKKLEFDTIKEKTS